MWVPRTRYGLSLAYGIGDHVTVGSSFQMGRFLWSDPSTADIPRFEDPRATTWEWNFSGRFHLPTGIDALDISLMLEFAWVRMPEVITICTQSICDGPLDYELDRERWRDRVRPTTGVEIGGDVLPWLHIYGVAAYQQTWRNQGSETIAEAIDRELFDANLKAHPYFLAGIGLEAQVSVVSLGTTLLIPVSGDWQYHLSPSLLIRAGFFLPGRSGKGS